MVALCIGGGLVSVYQRAVGPHRFVGFIKTGRRGAGGWARVNAHGKLVFSTILHNSPILLRFSELRLSRPGLQWCSLARCNQPKKKNPAYLCSHCPTAPGYQSLLEELSMLLPLQHKFQGLMLFAFLDFYFSSRTPVGHTRVSCFQVK